MADNPELTDEPEAADKPARVLHDTILGDKEGTWFYFYVQAGGHVKVLAENFETARKIISLRYPDKPYTGGISKSKAASGEPFLLQVPAYEYKENHPFEKDVKEMERRQGINYEYTTR